MKAKNPTNRPAPNQIALVRTATSPVSSANLTYANQSTRKGTLIALTLQKRPPYNNLLQQALSN